MHSWKITTQAIELILLLFNTFCNPGIFHTDPTKRGSLSFKKGNPVLSLCDVPSIAFIFSILPNLCCQLANHTKYFLVFWGCDLLKRDATNQSMKHINSNYAPRSQEETCPWMSSAHHHRSICLAEHLSAVSCFATDYTHRVTCEAHNSLIQACSNLNK